MFGSENMTCNCYGYEIVIVIDSNYEFVFEIEKNFVTLHRLPVE